MENKKTALVLSAGSVKGAFQAGAVYHLLKDGLKPDILRGSSVGAINASFLAASYADKKDWEVSGAELWDMWASISGPKQLIKKKRWALVNALIGRYDGMVDVSPLRKLVNDNISYEDLQDSNVDLAIATVDMLTGKIKYVSPINLDYMDYIMASAAIPLVMPMGRISGGAYYDGGIREAAPLKSAIEAGAERIAIVLTHPEELDSIELDTKKPMQVVDRLMTIIVNETMRNDIAQLEYINRLVDSKSKNAKDTVKDKGYRKVEYMVVRPASSMTVAIDDFGPKDISNLLAYGAEAIKHATWKF